MAKKTAFRNKFEKLTKPKLVHFGEKEFDALEKDAIQAPEVESVNDYIRYLCRTHPERSHNNKKK